MDEWVDILMGEWMAILMDILMDDWMAILMDILMDDWMASSSGAGFYNSAFGCSFFMLPSSSSSPPPPTVITELSFIHFGSVTLRLPDRGRVWCTNFTPLHTNIANQLMYDTQEQSTQVPHLFLHQ